MSISSQTLAMLRRTAGGFLTDVCDLDVEANATGEYGEPLPGTTRVASSVPCRLIQMGRANTSAAGEAASAETLRSEYRLIVSRDVTLSADMYVTTGGQTYSVVRVETELTDEAFHTAIIVRRD